MLNRLKKTTAFANEIGDGNLDATLDDVTEEDVLGISLIRMRDNLIKAKEIEEINRVEENKRTWATKGQAEFAEVLRDVSENINIFATNIISKLVKYTKSNQGSLFIINSENEEMLELVATYAYDRKKYINKSVEIGDGLVGTCAIEKETIFLTDIPNDYINIKSGLGGANPKSIVIVPLKLEDKIFGVIELASFNIYEEYQIKFIEKLGESIASTLSVTKTNIITNKLLEQSKLQAEELAAAEEEMRQNMEELQATQEESSRKEGEMRDTVNAINSILATAEIDLEGNIFNVNKLFTTFLYSADGDLMGKKYWELLSADYRKTLEDEWSKLLNGVTINLDAEYVVKKGNVWLHASFTPLKDEMDDYYKIIAMVTDQTKAKNLEKRITDYLNKIQILTHDLDIAKQKLEEVSKEDKDFKESLMDETEAQIDMLENKLQIAENELKQLREENDKLKNNS